MSFDAQPLTPDERRTLAIGGLTAFVGAVAGGLGSWLVDETKRALAARREAKARKATGAAGEANGGTS